VIGDLCICDLMLEHCDEVDGCLRPDEEWGQEYENDPDPTDDEEGRG
jgi:hypothetical protein